MPRWAVLRHAAASSRWAGRLDQFGQDAAQIAGVQECDRRPHGPVPGPLVEQPHPANADGVQRLADVLYTVPDVVQALPAPGQEPAHRGVRPEWLQQLNVTGRPVGAQGARSTRSAHGEHGLTHPLLLVHLKAYYLEPERGLVPPDRRVQVAAGDTDVIDAGEQR